MNKKIITELFKEVFRTRTVEEEIAKRYKDGHMRCPTHLSIGQEAVPAALSLIMRKNDFAVSSHRAHAHYLAKGGSLKRMIAEIYGKETGCSKGKGGSMHLIDLKSNFMGSTAIVGNTIPIGVGLGLSSIIKKKNQFSFIFFGDGAVEEGVFYESVNFAVVKKLPVVFICENNFYSVYSPLKVRQPKNRKIYKMVKAMGIKSFYNESDDPYAIYEYIKKKINFKDLNSGPYFFEFKNYRWREHCGPNFDNDIGYRQKNEFKKWIKKDSLLKIRKKLNFLSSKKVNMIEKKIKIEVIKAFEYAEKSKFPAASEAFKGVYAK
ncbi:thiamine pyrophosphate-dependent dehydrogenase E1 component subunit alpha [Candidatus Pelagibacter ubique]|jgi:TPP-dependent pyruvate/acetoin dehydrogenase alpha subunit|nr:thiamine pyrophosphate-dependent dehydrogenase E1 component subunit alpha [Candidatus Pelagibacter ubique]